MIIVYTSSLDDLTTKAAGLVSPAKFYDVRQDGKGSVGTVVVTTGSVSFVYVTAEDEGLQPNDLRLVGYIQARSVAVG